MTKSQPPKRPSKSVLLRVLNQVDAAGVRPIDALHLVALLEMEGWNDAVAQQLGFPDLFELARAAFPKVVDARPPVIVLTGTRPDRHANIRHFWRGTVRSAPTLLAVIAAFLAGGAGSAPGRETATFALALWGSFLLSGGLHQVITDRGKALLDFGQPKLALRFAVRSVALGVAVTAVLSLGLAAVAGVGPALLYGSLGVLWLSVAVLTLANWLTPYLIGLGLLCALLLARTLHLPLLPVVPGMAAFALVQAAVNLAAGFRRLRGLAKEQTVATVAPLLPRRSLLPVFLYGFLYYLFLLGDRFLVWTYAFSAAKADPAVQYEAALVWAGLVLALSAGAAEAVVQQLMAAVYRPASQPDGWHNRTYTRRLIRRWLQLQSGLLVCLTACSGLVYVLARLAAPLVGHGPAWALGGALVGYVLLGGGLFQLSVLMATNQVEQAVNLLLSAAGLNLTFGLVPPAVWQALPVFAGTGGYPPGVPGFVAGALLLWLLGSWSTYRTLRRADYVLYANA